LQDGPAHLSSQRHDEGVINPPYRFQGHLALLARIVRRGVRWSG
jgi:hypothetical protein